jgi:hypothetical protein
VVNGRFVSDVKNFIRLEQWSILHQIYKFELRKSQDISRSSERRSRECIPSSAHVRVRVTLMNSNFEYTSLKIVGYATSLVVQHFIRSSK